MVSQLHRCWCPDRGRLWCWHWAIVIREARAGSRLMLLLHKMCVLGCGEQPRG